MLKIWQLLNWLKRSFEIIIAIQSNESAVFSLLHLECECLSCRHLLFAGWVPSVPEIEH